MSFTESLSQFEYLSELYAQDAPATCLLTEYPSSNNPDARFRNTDKYIIHDPYPPPAQSLLKILGPHHLMCCWGNHLPVTSEMRPPQALLDHWQNFFGPPAYPRWQIFSKSQRYTTLFPHQSLPADQQEIDPARLYALHSKEAIGEIDCPQAAILEDVEIPCVIKLSHGYAGLGNFFIHSTKDRDKADAYIARHWPEARTVTTSLIKDVIGDYGLQFYLTRDGSVHLLGLTQQVFDGDGKWSGGIFSLNVQDTKLAQFACITEPVAKYLSRQGYYGLVGIDILETRGGDNYLVDLNPRLTGVTPFLLAARQLTKAGYTHGIYKPSLIYTGSLKHLLERASQNKAQSRLLILSAYEDQDTNKTICHISAHARSLAECQRQLAALH